MSSSVTVGEDAFRGFTFSSIPATSLSSDMVPTYEQDVTTVRLCFEEVPWNDQGFLRTVVDMRTESGITYTREHCKNVCWNQSHTCRLSETLAEF
jgi:hypothetical protein